MIKEVNPLVILVTGASGGIGRCIAAKLSAKGHKVYGTSRKKQLESPGFQWLLMDVNNQSDVDRVVRELMNVENRIDILINNAGIGMISSLEEAPELNIRKVLETNLYGVIRLTQAVLPYMRKQRSGKIINISSIAGLIGLPYRSIYCASKFAVEGLTESLRTEIARFNIQVCSIQPGDIRTDVRSNRVSHVPPDSHYHPELSYIEKMVDTEVNQGIDPEMVAILVDKLISKRKLQSKYVVARPFQKLGSSLKRYLPNHIFEILLKNKYQLK